MFSYIATIAGVQFYGLGINGAITGFILVDFRAHQQQAVLFACMRKLIKTNDLAGYALVSGTVERVNGGFVEEEGTRLPQHPQDVVWG